MLRSGQNSCIGPDPCLLPRQSHILDQMYEGGYLAVVDASKFFHQFPTYPDNRPYLGLKHPMLTHTCCKTRASLCNCATFAPSSSESKWSRLSLALVVGVLESLIEATPIRQVGHAYLRHFHLVVHPKGLGTGLEPYLTLISLTPAVRQDLKWWATFLKQGGGWYTRATESATLVPSWGDGSGTDMGRMYELPETKFIGPTHGEVPDSGLRMWKDKWSPLVCHFSSNWKELQTLSLTLQHIEEVDPIAVRGTTVFYFHDTSTTYCIAAIWIF
jgi:hypothetical protein